MEKNVFDVVIVGTGTAGIITARELGKKGNKGLLIDRRKDLNTFDYNSLVSFLKPEEFNLTNNIIAKKLNKVNIKSKRVSRELKVEALILDKRKLHEEILKSIDEQNVSIKTGVNIVDINVDELGKISSIIDRNGNLHESKIF